MKTLTLFNLLCLLLFSSNATSQDHQHDIAGFWKTINEKTLRPECVIAIYLYQDQYFGRIILTYDENGSVHDSIYHPKKRALGIVDNPYYSGMDILWGLKHKGNLYKEGSIADPEKGRIYGAEAWIDSGKLILRGKWFLFWRNQAWPPAADSDFPEGFEKPDLSTLIPVIPKTF